MDKEKAKRIFKIYNTVRLLLLFLLFLAIFIALCHARSVNGTVTLPHPPKKELELKKEYLPQIHGIQYEHEIQLKSSRFEIRNARLL